MEQELWQEIEQNVDVLSEEEKDIISLIFMTPIDIPGFPLPLSSFVVEVRLDGVLYNLQNSNRSVFAQHGAAKAQFDHVGYSFVLKTDDEDEELNYNRLNHQGDDDWAIVTRHSLDNVVKRAERADKKVKEGYYD